MASAVRNAVTQDVGAAAVLEMGIAAALIMGAASAFRVGSTALAATTDLSSSSNASSRA